MARTQKELKEMYMDIIKTEVWPGDEEMQKFEKKKVAYIVELSNGDIVDLEKPNIKKDFCFGAGMYGSCTQEEMNDAENMVGISRTSQDYFKEKNFEQVDRLITALSNCLPGSGYGMECYTYIHYYGQPDNSKLKGYSVTRLSHNPEYEPGYWSKQRDLKKLSVEDIKLIIEGLKEVRKDFEKRLNTYLKRYGLSKVNSWSYICD